MSKPTIAGKTPIAIQVEQGKDYFWCSCGLSKSQPLCDGSHKGSEFSPIKYTAEKNTTVHFCNCKHTHKQPLCDGSHSAL